MNWKCSFLLYFSGRECIEIVLILLEAFGRIPAKPSGSGDFFFGSFKITNSISLTVVGIFKFSSSY